MHAKSVLASFDKSRKKFIYRNWPAAVELIGKKIELKIEKLLLLINKHCKT